MTTLSQLPGDILAHLIHISDLSPAVIALWKTGNSILNSKLAKSITHVSLKDEIWSSTSRWPTCLSKLQNLRHLSINRSNSYLMSSSAQLSAEIRQLSPKLQLLRLHSEDAPKAFFNYAADDTIINTLYSKGSSRLFDMQAAFPTLETLEVGLNLGRLLASLVKTLLDSPIR